MPVVIRSRLGRSLLLATAAGAAAFVSLVGAAPDALAQSSPSAGHAAAGGSRSGARSDAGTRSNDTPGAFREPAAVQGGSVGAGNAAATTSGPSTELRGASASGPAPDQITGPIGPGDAARLVQAQMPRIRPCYETARAANPRLAGRVEVRFTIGRDGHVTQAIANGLPEAPEVATCVANALRATVFPQPENGSLPIIYPINFAPPPVIPTRGRRAAAANTHPPSAARAAH